LAMNGDELVDVAFGALLERHRSTGAAATVTVAQPSAQFGHDELIRDNLVTGFHEVSRVPYWVNCGIYVLSEEALGRFPEKGDHESTSFPELGGEGKLHAFRHTGLWLTVNTPKELRRADEYVSAHREWLGGAAALRSTRPGARHPRARSSSGPRRRTTSASSTSSARGSR